MRILLFATLVGACLSALGAPGASEASLEDRLKALELPTNQAPAAVPSEKLYAVQNRLTPLRWRHELVLGGAKNFSADDFLVSNEVRLAYYLHISDRWAVALSGSYVTNSLSASGERLLAQQKLLPDSAYVKYCGDLTANYSLFYGKFRVSMDSVFYFDQYIALGPGYVSLNTGGAPAAVGDVGFALWFGKWASVRVGVKDFFYNEKLLLSTRWTHNVLAHLDVGVLL